MKNDLKYWAVRTYDQLNGTSLVRELEMEVDAVASPGASVQFWADSKLYGLDEACRYLAGYHPEADLSGVQKKIQEIRRLAG